MLNNRAAICCHGIPAVTSSASGEAQRNSCCACFTQQSIFTAIQINCRLRLVARQKQTPRKMVRRCLAAWCSNTTTEESASIGSLKNQQSQVNGWLLCGGIQPSGMDPARTVCCAPLTSGGHNGQFGHWIPAGPWFNIKMSSYQHRKSHCGDKAILRPSFLHNGISYTGKTSLYWIGALSPSQNEDQGGGGGTHYNLGNG